MRRLAFCCLFLAHCGFSAIVFYEITAKSPTLFGIYLPGWGTTCRVEKSTPWNPTTGLVGLDKILHETEEATKFYGLLAGI